MSNGVAVVGLSCVLPDAPSWRHFGAKVRSGHISIGDIPADRWTTDQFYSPTFLDPGKAITKRGSFIQEPWAFDHRFFNMSPQEARQTDPQQRLIFQEAWRCVEDSGIALPRLQAGRTGTFSGLMANDHLQLLAESDASVESHSALGSYQAAAATRLAHVMGLDGPALSVDAHCASGLMSVHLACQSLNSHEIDYALVVSANLYLHPFRLISFSRAGMLSPRGLSSTFNQLADGYGPGEGAVALLLQRTEDADADQNHVYGVVQGSAANHTGTRRTPTAPTVASQVDVVSRSMEQANFDPVSVSYIETHGTGTSLGDPIEYEALVQAFSLDGGRQSAEPWCNLGSVKANYGHLEAAAGLAGLAKVLLMLRDKWISANPQLEVLNPLLRIDDTPFLFPTEEQPWSALGGVRRAGLSSFGIGGVNVHVSVEEHPGHHSVEAKPVVIAGGAAQKPVPFVLSARSLPALESLLDRWHDGIEQGHIFEETDLDRISRTLTMGREHHAIRIGTPVSSKEEILQFVRSGPTTSYARNPMERPWWAHLEPPQLTDGEGPPGLSDISLLNAVAIRRATNEPTWASVIDRVLAGDGGPVEWAVGRCLMLDALAELEVAVDGLIASGLGALPALLYSGAIELPQVVEAYAGGEDLMARPIAIRYPKVPVRIGVEGKLAEIRPAGMEPSRLHEFGQDLSVDGSAAVRLETTFLELIEHQRSFRSFIEEWNAAIEALSSFAPLPLDLPAGTTSLPSVDDRNRLVWAVAIQHALDQTTTRWQLSSRRVLTGEVTVLLDLLLAEHLRPEQVARLLVAESVDAVEGLVEEILNEWNRAGWTKELRSLAGFFDRDGPVELISVADIVGSQGSNTADVAGAVVTIRGDQRVGSEASPGDGVADGRWSFQAVDFTTTTFASTAVQLWRMGASVDWSKLLGEEPFPKAQLPTYQFESRTHRVPTSYEPVLPTADGTGAGGEPKSELAMVPGHARTELDFAAAPVAVDQMTWQLDLQWVETALPPSASESTLIVVEPDARAGDDLLTALEQTAHVITVDSGDQVERTKTNHWRLPTRDAAAWESLFARLEEQGLTPDGVMIWPSNADAFGHCLTALALAQAALRRGADSRLTILSTRLSTEEEPTVRPPLFGLAAALPYESDRVRLRCVDVAPSARSRFSAIVQSEIASDDRAHWARHVGGGRAIAVPSWMSTSADDDGAIGSQATVEPRTGIVPGGVYLVSGGAGGLGRQLLQHILSYDDAKAVIIARSDPGEVRRTIEADRLDGSRIDVWKADVEHLADLSHIVGSSMRRFGHIDGVFHLAGQISDQWLVRKSSDAIRSVLAPKLIGFSNLDVATADIDLSLFVVYGSIVGMVGNYGQADYACANSALETLVAKREVERDLGSRCGVTTLVEWPLWESTGMSIDDNDLSVFSSNGPLSPLPAERGLGLLERSMGQSGRISWLYGDVANAENVLISLGRIEPAGAEPETPLGSTDEIEQAVDDGLAEADLAEVMDFIVGVFAVQLSVDRSDVDVEEHIEGFGVDSIFATAITHAVSERFGRISPTLLFEARTIRRLSERVLATLTGPGGGGGASRTPVPAQPSTVAQVSAPAGATPRVSVGAQGPTANAGADEGVAKAGNADVPLAIIGVAGRYPEADTLEDFWRNLQTGQNSISDLPPGRWDGADTYQMYLKRGGFLGGVDQFDPQFFRISPREARVMDPQERLMLETAWHVLEDAGYPPHRLDQISRSERREIGVFVGSTSYTYDKWSTSELSDADSLLPLSTGWSIANRISYQFDFVGPSQTVDTACASSLSALHEAAHSLRRGECEMAIVGAVNLYLHPSKYSWLCQMQMVSPSATVSTFGAAADGFVPGEGVGAVLLRPLPDALAANDRILGLVVGTAVGHGGKTNGYTVPDPSAQRSVIASAIAAANVEPETITYIEAHGTGTILGDPIEWAGLEQAYPTPPLPTVAGQRVRSVGSVKTNIGHLEGAAGLAGLTKVLLQLKHQLKAPSLNSVPANPNIDFSGSALAVQTDLAPWPAIVDETGRPLPRRAGISAFGAGGANAHVIIEEAPPTAQIAVDTPGPQLVVLSANTAEALKSSAEQFGQWLRLGFGHGYSLAEIAYNLHVHREPMEHRLAVVADSIQGLIDAFALFVEGVASNDLGADPGFVVGSVVDGHGSVMGIDAEEASAATEKGDLAQLARLWVRGSDIDVGHLHREAGRHIEMPHYRFQHESFWLNAPAAPGTGDSATTSHSSGPLVFQNRTTVLTESDFFLNDHRVRGVPILPAVAYVESLIAMTMASRPPNAAPSPVVIANTTFQSAFLLERGDRELSVVTDELSGRFQVTSSDDAGAQLVHAEGKIAALDGFDPVRFEPREVLDRCSPPVGATEFYGRIAEMGLELGPALQAVTSAGFGTNEALAELDLPASLVHDRERFYLHPTVFDSALQSSLWLIRQSDASGRLFLPFMLGQVYVWGPTPARCWSHVRLVSSTDEAKKLEIDLIDDRGQPVLSVRNFWLRPWDRDGDGGEAPTANTAAAGYLTPNWEEVEERQTGAVVGSSTSRSTIWLASDKLAADRIAATEVGESIVVAFPGTECRRLGPNRYELTGDWQADFARIESEIGEIDGVVVQPARHAFNGEISELRAQIEGALLEAPNIIRAVASLQGKHTISLLYLVPTDQPGFQAIGGLLRTAQREVVRLRTVLVEVTDDIEHDPQTYGRALAELRICGEDGSANEVRINGQRRLRRHWVDVASSEPGSTAVRAPSAPVVLLTGGNGGLGQLLAVHLAERDQARIVLVGRSAGSASTEDLISEIGRRGGTAIYVSGDVGEVAGADRAVAAAIERFGRLDSIVHAAGVLADEFVMRLEPSHVRSALEAKAFGAVALDQATRNQDLSSFVLFSSIAGAVGTVGQGAYAAANAFLDGFSQWRNRQRDLGLRRGPTASILWPLWASQGMQVDAETAASLKRSFDLSPLPAEDGLKAFDDLQQAEGPVLVVPGVGRRLRQELHAAEPEQTAMTRTDADDRSERDAAGHEPLAVSASALAPLDLLGTLSSDVAALVAEIIEMDPGRIDYQTDIGGYGFDSLAFGRLANRLSERFDADLTPATFFEYTTVAQIAELIAEMNPSLAQPPATNEGPQMPAGARPEQAPVPVPTGDGSISGASRRNDSRTDAVAIIGMNGVFPRSENIAELWQHLLDGDDLVTEIPEDRWDWREHFGDPMKELNKTNSKWGGFIPDADKFDAKFFGISPREAQLMDPQQRIFLQTAYGAIEDAGYAPSELAGSKTGLYVGAASHDYYELLRDAGVPIEGYTTTGLFHAILANRVSYLLDLRGPSFPIDTACSSSLVAMRSAVEALQVGSCETALVGGVNLIFSPTIYVSFARAGMLSPTGRCRTFDAGADGYVRAEGCGVLLLKPLPRALADGDSIRAVIAGSAVNHGGRVSTMTTPNPTAQSQLINAAMSEADIGSETVGFVEMHGTGTALGDPIEINGLKRALEHANRSTVPDRPPTVVGSIKSNIGHLEAASGVAGVIKAISCMETGIIPGNLHLQELNPHIRIGDAPLQIADRQLRWPDRRDGNGELVPRRSAISSFGFGGANAHILLEQHPAETAPPRPIPPDAGNELFVISAKSEDSLVRYLQRHHDHLEALLSTQSSDATASVDDVATVVAEVLGLGSSSQLGANETLADLGFDHLLLHELASRLSLDESLSRPALDDSLSSIATRVGGSGPADTDQIRTLHQLLADVAFTSQVGRDPMAHRVAILASSLAGLVDTLGRCIDAGSSLDSISGLALPNVFVGSADANADVDPAATAGNGAAALAARWVTGDDVDWVTAFGHDNRRRVPLATYPFARTRHWIPQPVGLSGDRSVEVVTGDNPDSVKDGGATQIEFRPDQPVVTEHVVAGRKLVPGVVHLDSYRRHLALSPNQPLRLEQVTWAKPIAVQSSTVTVAVSDRSAPPEAAESAPALRRLSLAAVVGDERPYSYATAVQPGPRPSELRDIDRLIEGCSSVLTSDEIYSAFEAIGISYGPMYRGITDAWLADGFGIALVENAGDDGPEDSYSPTVLDAALQMIALVDRDGHLDLGPLRLPFATGAFEVWSPLPSRSYVITNATGDGGFNTEIIDERGAVCASFSDVSVRAAPVPAEARADTDRMIFTSRWEERPNHSSISALELGTGKTLIVGGRASRPLTQRLSTALGSASFLHETSDSDAIEAVLDREGPFESIWYLGGMAGRKPSPKQAQSIESVGGGVVDLHRLLRLLADRAELGRLTNLVVVVDDTTDSDGFAPTNPSGRALVGLARSIGREYGRLTVDCIDVCGVDITDSSPEALDDIVATLLSEQSTGEPLDLSFDGRSRKVRVLRPTKIIDSARSAFRDGGVYVIFGGTGGIGGQLATYLAERHRAHVAIVGRGTVADRAQASATMRNYQADVADAVEVERVLQEIERDLGQIHGVFHAAMVLRDCTLARMDHADLVDVLRPKAAGTETLCRALAARSIDFLALFSSVQSFTTAPGQGNYAAGSAAQDAIAQWARPFAGFPIYTINWGYWGDVGRVASPAMNATMQARGYGALDADVGFAVLERVLGSDYHETVVIDADEAVLGAIGVEFDDLPSSAEQVDRSVTLPTSAELWGQGSWFEHRICRSVLDLFMSVGVLSEPGVAFSFEQIVSTTGCREDQLPLLHGLLAILERGRFIGRHDDGESFGLVASDAAAVPPESSQYSDRDQQELGPRAKLVEHCLSQLLDVLSGTVSGHDVLFSAGSVERVAEVYRSDPPAVYSSLLLAEVVAESVRNNPEPEVRILEVGAGTGSTTEHVLAKLPFDRSYHYGFTDMSRKFLLDFEAAWAGPSSVDLQADLLDIGRDPIDQGFSSGSYDMLIASNVVHATDDLDSTLSNCRKLLRPDGLLMLTEVTRVLAFHTVTFGLLEAWWSNKALDGRMDHSPLLDENSWRRRLEAVGFEAIAILGRDVDGRVPSQRVIVARVSPSMTSNERTPVPSSAAHNNTNDTGPPQVYRATTGELEGATMKIQPEEGGVDIALVLAEETADALRCSPEEVDGGSAFSEIGVDSIVGVELVNRINERLNINLKTVVIFDYPTLDELASFIEAEHRPKPAAPVVEPPISAPAPAPIVASPAPIVASPPQSPPIEQPRVRPEAEESARPFDLSSYRRPAVRFNRPGRASDLTFVDQQPQPIGPGEVEVEVAAFPINASDALAIQGLYPLMPDFPFTPGVEAAGTISRVGPGVENVVVGDPVIALTRPEMGGQARYVVTDADFVVRKPINLDFTEAGSVPVAFLAMDLAMEKAALGRGDTIYIPSASGSNGMVAVQLAKALGAVVVASASSDHKVDYLRGLGVDHAFNYRTTDPSDAVSQFTEGRGVDVVVNMQADGLQLGLNVLAPEGRYIETAVFGLRSANQVDLSHLVDNQTFQSLNVKKYFLTHRDQRQPRLTRMAQMLTDGVVRPLVASTFDFGDLLAAYQAKQNRDLIGRIVVEPRSNGGTAAAVVTTRPPREVDAPQSIAIVGMSGRFPGADDVQGLWDLVKDGRTIVDDAPSTRWSSDFYDADRQRLDRTYCNRGGFLDAVDQFDAGFFSMSGKEAELTDPQQRIFMEESWRALEDAGLTASMLEGMRCGVFVGAGPSDYLRRMDHLGIEKPAQVFWGNEASILAARISYGLNLRGPAVAVNTACSSSLVSLHLACQSILAGDSDLALAGGVFLMLSPEYLVVASNGNMLAPDGRCKTFDAAADGFGPSEGAGVLVLKPLDAARRDGDRIHGTILGSAINQDGRTNGITAPSGRSQTDVERQAYARAGISPVDIGYVEAHGTGTILGDPIEVDALTTTFRQSTSASGYCAIGSVKSNIGHTAAAAGVAGIIKVLLSLKHGQIPPSAGFSNPNPHIDFASTPFYVSRGLSLWPGQRGQRIAAVSGFGFSGTNAHVVIGDGPRDERAPVVADHSGPLTFPLSAVTESGVRRIATDLADWLQSGDGQSVRLDDVAYTLQVRRTHREQRRIVRASDRAELISHLRSIDESENNQANDDGLASWLNGGDHDWVSDWTSADMQVVSLPPYPFDRQRYWYSATDDAYGSSLQRSTETTNLPAAAEASIEAVLAEFVAGNLSTQHVEAILDGI